MERKNYRGYEYQISEDMEITIYGKIDRNSTYATGGVKSMDCAVMIAKSVIDKAIRSGNNF